MKKILCIFALLLFIAAPLSAHAENIVKATLVAQSDSLVAGKNTRLGVMLDMPDGWHTYTKDPGDSGLPTTFKWTLPDGFSASEIHWPPAKTFKEGDLTTYGYAGTVLLPVTLSVPSVLSQSNYTFTVKADWLVCNDICIPESQTLSLDMPVGIGAPSSQASLFEVKTQALDVDAPSLWLAIAFALLGGLILNLMPCVLPVLSLKALSIAKKAGAERAHTIAHGAAYTLGILLTFATLAGVLIGLQQAGQAVGWGYQMQSPAFVTFMIFLLFLVGLSLSGVFHLPVLLGSVGIREGHSVRGSFFTGVLATLVATPCTAPFMASAIGVALTLSPIAAMAVFLSLGFGLALPFLLICMFPTALRFLPKPGAWMERFKEFLAFPMYASVIWLLWVLGLQVGMGNAALVLGALLLVVFVLWLRTKFSWVLLIVIALGTFAILQKPSNELPSVPYSKALLSQLREEGKAVYVDVTAAWCITCQVNKHVALDRENTQRVFKEKDIVLMVADWTNKDADITEYLASFGFNGVPLNVFYPAGGEPVVLPQILSEQLVIDTVSK